MALEKRNLQREQEALKELAPKFSGFQQDPEIKASLEREIRRRAYGTSRPVFEEKFNIPRLRKEVERPGMSQVVSRLQDSAKRRSDAQEASFAKAFQDIKDPRFRESAIANARSQTRERFGGLAERAAKLYGLQKQETEDKLNRAQQRLKEERKFAGELAQQDDALDQALAEMMAMKQLESMGISSGGGRRRSGGRRGGGRRRSSGGSKGGNLERVLNESGGFTFLEDGVPIPVARYAALKGQDISTALKGSLDPGDQQFRSDVKGMLGEIGDGRSAADAQQELMERFPQIYGGQQEERQPLPPRNPRDIFGVERAFSPEFVRRVNRKNKKKVTATEVDVI